MTAAELAQAIYDDWTARPDSALGPQPFTQIAHDGILAMCSAVAYGIQLDGGGGGYTPSWRWDVLAGTGTGFALTKTPVENSLQVFRNGLLELGWTLVGTTLTLAETRTEGDSDLRAHYQYVELM